MSYSAFSELGVRAAVRDLVAEVQGIYLADEIPWVVGYSGGKDSTATLQLVWMALSELPDSAHRKPVHVISTDTLVENPVVSAWVRRSLESLNEAAAESGLPITAQMLTPSVEDTFWVNLIGRGYPAPRPKFRWCTERLKIKPSNAFIEEVVRSNGEAILVLGTRKHESTRRTANMAKYEAQRVRARLSPNASLPNSLIFSPIEDWTNDDVWVFLMQFKNPWGHANEDLLTMYQGASEDGECPLVVDASTPSCGDSRFGCWVCTMVDQDRSMSAMIQNDEEKEWMMPLLQLRDALGVGDDRDLRDYRRMDGRLTFFNDRLVHGPYTQEARANWLRRVLEAQTWVRRNGPPHVANIELITPDEIAEIRRIWVVEKFEIEDLAPAIYLDVVGERLPSSGLDDNAPFGADELELLAAACEGDRGLYELIRELLVVEWRFRTMSRRAGLFERLTAALKRGSFSSEAEAEERARRRKVARDGVEEQLERLVAMAGVSEGGGRQ